MKEIVIYEFQLKSIVEALRLTNNLHECLKGETSFDRQVRQAYEYAKNALNGEKDITVNYITGKSIKNKPQKNLGLVTKKLTHYENKLLLYNLSRKTPMPLGSWDVRLTLFVNVFFNCFHICIPKYKKYFLK